MNTDTIMLGTRSGWGDDFPIGIQTEDARHHTYIIGKTGSGKTTLLRNMIIQHLYLGHGLALLDPHGDLAEELLDHFPTSRADDLVYFNPGDLEFPIGLNLLANVPSDSRHLVASGIVAAFKGIWRDSWGPRMEYILYNALAALLDCQNTSLLGVNRMLTDAEYRAWVIRQVLDPFVRNFWAEEFSGYDARFVRESIAPIQNKIGQFLMNPPIRNILGQVKSKIDFRFMMDTGRVFIANLSKGKLGADKANLLGSLLATQFQLAAMSRTDTPEAERRDFHLFIDEFHNFTTDTFAAMLAEARKYRLCLTLSHQYLDQLSPEVRQAVFGNAGTMIAFRIGHTDAELLAKEFANTFITGQFVELDRYQIFIRLLENGVTSTPFPAKTLPALDNRHTRRQELVDRSRERYAARRGTVEQKLRRWTESPISSSDTFQQTRRNHRFARPAISPKASGGSAAKRTRQYRGGVLPI
jgi:DNA segregation ATPase FtsK/SpoIIIE-like protein